jgi:hypothetical protein
MLVASVIKGRATIDCDSNLAFYTTDPSKEMVMPLRGGHDISNPAIPSGVKKRVTTLLVAGQLDLFTRHSTRRPRNLKTATQPPAGYLALHQTRSAIEGITPPVIKPSFQPE